MNTNRINAGTVKRAFLAGAKSLESKKDWINELNVFPVPDGDTGTNMTLTILAAAREVAQLEEPTMAQLARAISSGSLRGARGNSGVILSQLFRGFTREIQGEETLDTEILARAMVRGTETAYKAVMKPKEGTILTVARGMSEKAAEIAAETEDIEAFALAVLQEGEHVLSQTPEMLPVLKQAGVVDSGGQGLMQVMKGIFDGLTGKEVSFEEPELSSGAVKAAVEREEQEITFGYCTEFLIRLEKPFGGEQESELKAYLDSIGDSIVVVSDDEIVKVHVHTDHPGLAFEKGLTFGSLSSMKVDNMREEHRERLIQDSERLAREQAQKKPEAAEKEFGFIAVSSGAGLSEIFEGIGADYVIEGGQTMNPSTEDMLNAISRVPAKHIFILPNNKNIILAAEQARELTEDKEILVVPSKTVPQGITALVNFMPELSAEENLENMRQEMELVKTIQITYAVRDTQLGEFEIHQGDLIAVGDDGVTAAGKSVASTALEAMKSVLTEDNELITLYYGKDITEDEANALKDQAQEMFPDMEFEVQNGGQPVYYYIISAE